MIFNEFIEALLDFVLILLIPVIVISLYKIPLLCGIYFHKYNFFRLKYLDHQHPYNRDYLTDQEIQKIQEITDYDGDARWSIFMVFISLVNDILALLSFTLIILFIYRLFILLKIIDYDLNFFSFNKYHERLEKKIKKSDPINQRIPENQNNRITVIDNHNTSPPKNLDDPFHPHIFMYLQAFLVIFDIIFILMFFVVIVIFPWRICYITQALVESWNNLRQNALKNSEQKQNRESARWEIFINFICGFLDYLTFALLIINLLAFWRYNAYLRRLSDLCLLSIEEYCKKYNREFERKFDILRVEVLIISWNLLIDLLISPSAFISIICIWTWPKLYKNLSKEHPRKFCNHRGIVMENCLFGILDIICFILLAIVFLTGIRIMTAISLFSFHRKKKENKDLNERLMMNNEQLNNPSREKVEEIIIKNTTSFDANHILLPDTNPPIAISQFENNNLDILESKKVLEPQNPVENHSLYLSDPLKEDSEDSEYEGIGIFDVFMIILYL